MKKNKLPYREGTWFSVPLRTGGFAVGVVAKLDGHGGIFGYFFKPARSGLPTMAELSQLASQDAVFMRRFGDLGILKGKWPIVGHSEHWDAPSWPMPPFVSVDRVSGKAFLVTLGDRFEELSRQDHVPSSADRYPEDADSGYGAVELHLTRICSETAP
jgi:hypothetical protein